MKTKNLDLNRAYTFSNFFELKIEAKDLAQEFGYSLERKWLQLPQFQGELDRIQETQSRITEILPYVSLGNETARREFMISPIMHDLIHYAKIEIRIEYKLKVTEQLQGVFDYLLQSPNYVIVVEAKKEDLDFGMTQLVAELIALDHWLDDFPQTTILGAVTTGRIWQFAKLDRQTKHLEQGLENYQIPEQFDPVLRILMQAVTTN